MSRSMISTIVFTVFLAAGSLTLMMIYSDPWVPITMGYCIIGIYADKISMMHGSIALTCKYIAATFGILINAYAYFQRSFSLLYCLVLVVYIWQCW
jgi:hypothetical protein